MAKLATIGLPGRLDRGCAVDGGISQILAADPVVAIGVSGGKDSCALALATVAYLDAIGHKGPRVLIHSDLGRVEWADSLPTCERLAAATGLELITVKRAAGDMMDRWLVRWRNNIRRYQTLQCVKVILPWSTPSMRFCTSELKTDVICRALVKRFPGRVIVSAAGVRRDESKARENTPVFEGQGKLKNRKHATTGVDWNPLIHWSTRDVLAFLAGRGFDLHEAYTTYGSSRVSCVFCIMGSGDDLRAAASCADNADVYREMVDLEIASSFAFQGSRWLGDVAPHLLTEEQRVGLVAAKARAAARVALEKRVPKHLLYTSGWPTVMPTDEEAEMIASLRHEVAEVLGIVVEYPTGEAVSARYAELMARNEARKAKKAGVEERRAKRAAARA